MLILLYTNGKWRKNGDIPHYFRQLVKPQQAHGEVIMRNVPILTREKGDRHLFPVNSGMLLSNLTEKGAGTFFLFFQRIMSNVRLASEKIRNSHIVSGEYENGRHPPPIQS
jgi:hypothetical protein